jgi:hypothetical protein
MYHVRGTSQARETTHFRIITLMVFIRAVGARRSKGLDLVPHRKKIILLIHLPWEPL